MPTSVSCRCRLLCWCVYGYVLLSALTVQDLLMDILRVLSSPALEVRKKTLGLVLDLVNSRNVEEVCCTVVVWVVGSCVCWCRW